MTFLEKTYASGLTFEESIQQPDDISFQAVGAVVDHAHHLAGHAASAASDQARAFDEIAVRTTHLTTVLTQTEQDLSNSTGRAETVRGTTQDQIRQIAEEIRDRLKDSTQHLEQKGETAQQVLKSIVAIGQKIRILAMNARIEAARAGEHGLGFAVVAREVGTLATHTLDQTEEAGKALDFADVFEILDQTVEQVSQQLATLQTLTEGSLGDLETMLGGVAERVEDISDHNSVIREMIDLGNATRTRALDKMEWVSDELGQLGQCLSGPVQQRPSQLTSLTKAQALVVDPAYDRLSDIKARGVLRVAVEPSFVGLSFRRRLGAQLEGLDVAYAEAFAKWLGVKCEFIEHPWDQLTELLVAGRRPGESPADLVWSALPPSASFRGVAYSETYTWLPFVMARRIGDERIKDINSLDGKVVGIINDPGAFDVLEAAGVRWKANADKAGGKVMLANLVAYSDQTRIHDCLANGVVDAFCVDLPIYHWACAAEESPWKGQIEICSGNIADQPYYYSVGVAAEAASYELLSEVNRFLKQFQGSAERATLERHWQGKPYDGRVCYRDEPGNLMGEADLKLLQP